MNKEATTQQQAVVEITQQAIGSAVVTGAAVSIPIGTIYYYMPKTMRLIKTRAARHPIKKKVTAITDRDGDEKQNEASEETVGTSIAGNEEISLSI